MERITAEDVAGWAIWGDTNASGRTYGEGSQLKFSGHQVIGPKAQC